MDRSKSIETYYSSYQTPIEVLKVGSKKSAKVGHKSNKLLSHLQLDNSQNTNSPFSLVLNSDSYVFSWELNIPKLLDVEEVGGANFYGFLLNYFL